MGPMTHPPAPPEPERNRAWARYTRGWARLSHPALQAVTGYVCVVTALLLTLLAQGTAFLTIILLLGGPDAIEGQLQEMRQHPEVLLAAAFLVVTAGVQVWWWVRGQARAPLATVAFLAALRFLGGPPNIWLLAGALPVAWLCLRAWQLGQPAPGDHKGVHA